MKTDATNHDWIVDLGQRLAFRGSSVIRFDRNQDQTFDMTFVAGGDCSLEEQCLIAGEAVAAIRSKIRFG